MKKSIGSEFTRKVHKEALNKYLSQLDKILEGKWAWRISEKNQT